LQGDLILQSFVNLCNFQKNVATVLTRIFVEVAVKQAIKFFLEVIQKKTTAA